MLISQRMYKALRAVLFMIDAEKAHYIAMNGLKLLCRISFIKTLIKKKYSVNYTYSSENARPFNLRFRNPVGLGAGFDKNAKYLHELDALGFGFVETGTITPLPQKGNKKPRLFRLPKDKALINRMGFNNDGAEIIAGRLRKWIAHNHYRENGMPRLIIGGNIGKNKQTSNADAWKDYECCFNILHECVDYFVVNVSSPNTTGLRELQEKDALSLILKKLQAANAEKKVPKPILLKIAPDLQQEQIDDIIDLALEINLDGLIVSNTTTGRGFLKTASAEIEKKGEGGLSGLPLKKRSTDIIQYIKAKSGNRIQIIGSGGIFTAADAKEKFNAGASLIQVWTGFIYEGPAIVKKICKGL